jgi:hypothetical protein
MSFHLCFARYVGAEDIYAGFIDQWARKVVTPLSFDTVTG